MNMAHGEKIAICPPLEGEWKFLRPPGHHPFAFDFVQTDTSRRRTHRNHWANFVLNKIPAEAFFCWGKPVFSPVSGEVFRVGNGWHDHEYTNLWKTIKIWFDATYRFKPQQVNGILDIRPNAGNYVMIKSDSGYIAFLAHIKNNSIQVRQGQQVAPGELIGFVGNSGNSTAPHLHINLFDQMDDPYSAKVLPFVFSAYQEYGTKNQWLDCRQSIPSVGACVKFQRSSENAV